MVTADSSSRVVGQKLNIVAGRYQQDLATCHFGNRSKEILKFARLVVGGVPDNQESSMRMPSDAVLEASLPCSLKGLGDRRIVEEDIRP